MKYKQKTIPSTTGFQFKKEENRRSTINEYYREKIQGTTVINKSTGLEICFTSEGRGKISANRNIGEINAAAVKILPKMMKVAEYSNFGEPKPTDKKNVIGYLNFKCKVKVKGNLHHLRISVKLKTDMKAYYNHTVNRY